MWPFKKKQTGPRVLWVDHWREDGSLDIRILRVRKVEGRFFVSKYGTDDDYELFILLPGGKVRGKNRLTWEKIDDIPGLTDAMPAAESGASTANT